MKVLYEPSSHSLTLKDVNSKDMALYEMPKDIKFLSVESGQLDSLTVPEGVIEVNCEYLGLRELHLPDSLEDLFCKRNKLEHLHLPSNVELVDARSNHISRITWKESPQSLYTILLCRNNISSLHFDTPENMNFICLCENPTKRCSKSIYNLIQYRIETYDLHLENYDFKRWVGHTGEWQASDGERITDKCCINWSFGKDYETNPRFLDLDDDTLARFGYIDFPTLNSWK